MTPPWIDQHENVYINTQTFRTSPIFVAMMGIKSFRCRMLDNYNTPDNKIAPKMELFLKQCSEVFLKTVLEM